MRLNCISRYARLLAFCGVMIAGVARAQDYNPAPVVAPPNGSLTVAASPNGIDWLNTMLGLTPSFLNSDGTVSASYVNMAKPPTTPPSSASSCAAGAIEWDANFIYVCAAANTWKRAALATF